MDLTHVLVRAFANVAVSIDLSDDEAIDPDIATEIMESVAAMFRDLPEEDCRSVAVMMVEIAELESDPERKRSMQQLPEGIGLVDED